GGRPGGAGLPAHARSRRPRRSRRRAAATGRSRRRGVRARPQEGCARSACLTLRVGVVGGGLIAQAMHLPYLSEKRDRFTVAALDRAARVVQVGTMKRHDPAYERMLAELPVSAETLRYVDVVVNDPEFEPYFGSEIVRGADVPRELIDATRRGEADQVEEAV